MAVDTPLSPPPDDTAALKRTLQEMGARLDEAIRLLSVISNLTAIPARAAKPEQGARALLEVLVRNVSGADMCSLLVQDKQDGELKLLAARGQADLCGEPEGPYNRDLAFQVGEGVAGLAFQRNEPVFWDRRSPDFERLKRGPELGNPMSLASLPLTTLGKKLGVLNISFCHEEPFTTFRRNDLVLLSGVVANVLQTFSLKAEVDDYAASLVDRVLDSQEQYRRLFEDSLLGIFRVTAHGELITANPAFARLFGYESPHLMLAEVNDLARDLCAEPGEQPGVIERIRTSQGLVKQEIRFRRRDGSDFLGRLAAWTVTGTNGRLQHLEGFLEDLTDRRRLEERLAHSLALGRSLVTACPLGCLITDAAGVVREINAKARDILDPAARNDLKGLDLTAWEPLAGLAPELRACLDAGEERRARLEYTPPGGGVSISLRFSLSALREPSGRILGLQCLLEEEGAAPEGE